MRTILYGSEAYSRTNYYILHWPKADAAGYNGQVLVPGIGDIKCSDCGARPKHTEHWFALLKGGRTCTSCAAEFLYWHFYSGPNRSNFSYQYFRVAVSDAV